jgi:DNA-binding GntR family transcriptional regulator
MGAAEASKTSADRIYEEIRRSIIVGHWRSGERLGLETLADRYGTSVTPVREALQMLTQEGLVTNKPHAGFFVTEITLKELSDMLELRGILEVAAVERAAKRITQATLEELEQVHAGYTGDDETSSERYVTENRRLHVTIAEASGNQELAKELGRLHDRLARFFVFVQSGDEMEKRHRDLLDALRNRDVEAAREAIQQEVRETRQLTLEHVIREDGVAWQVGAGSFPDQKES